MITYEKACEIAMDIKSKEFPSFTFAEVTEIEDRWAFVFSVDADTVMTPAPSFFVHKENGRVEWFSIPPLENLHLIKNGKRIAFDMKVEKEK